jgi:hypothetical protein
MICPGFRQRDEVDVALRPYVDDALMRERLRREAAAELIRDYEAEHGEITEDEMKALWQEGER